MNKNVAEWINKLLPTRYATIRYRSRWLSNRDISDVVKPKSNYDWFTLSSLLVSSTVFIVAHVARVMARGTWLSLAME